MSVPNATLSAPIVRATLETFALPSILNEPVTSPPPNVTVRADAHALAVSASHPHRIIGINGLTLHKYTVY